MNGKKLFLFVAFICSWNSTQSMIIVDTDKYPSLSNLIRFGQNTLLKQVLEKKDIDINEQSGFSNDSYVHIATEENNVEALKILLNQSTINIDLLDDKENTPLNIACKYERPECLQLLIKAGADVNHKNYYGNTPLNGGIRSRISYNSIQYLLHTANPNIANINNFTPLLTAVQDYIANKDHHMSSIRMAIEDCYPPTFEDIKATAKLLITSGTDISYMGGSGMIKKTAATLATSNGDPDLADLIENYARKRDDVFKKIDNAVTFADLDSSGITPPGCALKDTQGNNLMHYVLKNPDNINLHLIDELLHHRPKLAHLPNFSGIKPIDLIGENKKLKMKFTKCINTDELY